MILVDAFTLFRNKTIKIQTYLIIGFFISLPLIFFLLLFSQEDSPLQFNHSTPGEMGPCTPTSSEVALDEVDVTVFYPTPGSCTDGTESPFPAIVFAHGFSMFGISDGVAHNVGNGEHLASWGYIVALPKLPDDFENRTEIVIDVLDFLTKANRLPFSFLHRMVDINRFAATGHSLGGATALAVAARDSRIKAVVGLDPVFHTGGPFGGDIVWDPSLEAPNILAPTAILGSPADPCNSENDSYEIYPLVGANLKAHYFLVDSNHWVYTDPGNPLFFSFCGGETSPELTDLSQKYMTAWFNFYLYNRFGDYNFIYGASVKQDVKEGLTILDVNSYPGLVFIPMLTK
jgi:dienelactone hydrolase